MNSPWDLITTLGVQFYNINDEKLTQGDTCCKIYSKIPCIVEEDLDSLRNDFVCEEFGCNSQFTSILELETHYRARHTHVCQACRMIFPSFHLLDRHVVESHDSFFQIASQKKPMYACLLESCSEIFATPSERKEHCISLHKFPHDFRYDLMWRKIKVPKQSNLRNNNHKQVRKTNKNKCAKTNQEEVMEVSFENTPDTTTTYSAKIPGNFLRKKNRVPNSISFGMGVPKGFTYKHWHQRNNPCGTKTHIDQISMSDMAEALDDMES